MLQAAVLQCCIQCISVRGCDAELSVLDSWLGLQGPQQVAGSSSNFVLAESGCGAGLARKHSTGSSVILVCYSALAQQAQHRHVLYSAAQQLTDSLCQ
jgi:hypothetical protein